MVFVGAIVGSGIFLFAAKDRETSTNSSTGGGSNTTRENTKTSAAVEGGGTYLDYNEAKLAQTDGEKYLFFHAPWCPQCRSIEADIQSGSIPKGVNLLKVDYDSNQVLRRKYGVTLQTTFVKLDKNNQQVGKYVAYDEPTFDSVLENFILK